MKKRVHKAFAITAAVMLMLGTTVIASAAGNSGMLNGYSWSTSLTGGSRSVVASTSYSHSQSARSVSLTATYIGPGFTGTRTSSSGNGYYTGSVSASVSPPGSSDRYISASSSHTIDSLSDSLYTSIN